ncbi:leukotriene A4 hydrolase [Tribonema minus]|uniref:Leukotriene A4 hydrolase n=1 Tax=Tribonema minus TaxID=303371 RepID=A0A835YHW6_9STRA|nr:leukotriene A4 hydrolase [Tribonema minus]
MAAEESQRDFSSQSNSGSVHGTHLSLKLAVDFEAKVITGSATYTVKVVENGATQFVLDTSTLVITKVEVDGVRAKFRQHVEHQTFGSALEITLPGAERAAGSTATVSIFYNTSPRSSAVQWLPPAQTAGKARPYLFTQCQAIHARALLPCQDTPAAKLTYDATVEVPEWATCLMSALSTGAPATAGSSEGMRTFGFHQPVPVPSYLIALAVGDLASREISHRCRIWSEPSMVDAAAHDFAQTEEFLTAAEELTCPYEFLTAAEELTCPYVWGRYDVLCLPPSFPYGGMENPCLTFVTPTLLTGDRSLAFVVAHEISHSWTGNLITNRTWQSFWLNEGFTMWLERKIMSRVTRDARYYDFDAHIGWNHLKEDIALFESKGSAALTALCPPLEGIDPDDAFSSVPYEKGFALLNELQTRIGAEAFEEFVKTYIDNFKFGTITGTQFRAFVQASSYFKGDALDGLDWDEWLFAPGMPRNKPNALALEVLRAMDAAYGLSAARNSELAFRWQLLCLRRRADFIVSHVLEFITSQGRMKFTRPLYRELNKRPETASQAVDAFMANADFYHPICRAMVAKDLGLQMKKNMSRSLRCARYA